MPFIQLTPEKIVNLKHIVSIDYTPAKSAFFDDEEQKEIPARLSCIIITLNSVTANPYCSWNEERQQYATESEVLKLWNRDDLWQEFKSLSSAKIMAPRQVSKADLEPTIVLLTEQLSEYKERKEELYDILGQK